MSLPEDLQKFDLSLMLGMRHTRSHSQGGEEGRGGVGHPGGGEGGRMSKEERSCEAVIVHKFLQTRHKFVHKS